MADRECPLSDREIEVLQLVATGATNHQIARELYISVNTVKVHLRNIFTKLEVNSRTEATMVALREGWVVVEGVTGEGEAQEAPREAIPAEPPVVVPLSWPRRASLILGAAVLLALLVWARLPGTQSAPRSGNEFTDRSATTHAVLPAEASRWQERTPVSPPRARLALAFYKGALYAIGGDTPNSIIGQVMRYDLQRDTWSPGADKPTAVANIGAAVLEGRIYVPGGYTAKGEVTDVLEIYDPEADQWSDGTPLPAPRCAYGLAALEGQLYLFGGWDGRSYVSSAYRYDPQTDTWNELASMEIPRGFLGAAALGRHIYVAGGYDGAREHALCQVYDPEEAKWSACPPMTVGRGGLGVTAIGGRLYAIGGGISGSWEIVSNEWYDPQRGIWASFETPVIGQWRNPGVATDGSSIFAVGGWSGEYLPNTEEYRALYRLFLPAAP